LNSKFEKLSRRTANLESWEGSLSTALNYKHLSVFPVAVKLGASAPTDALRAVGTSGGVLIDVLQFSNVVQNDTYFYVEIPSDMDTGLPIQFYAHWLPGAAWTAGNYVYRIEYLLHSPGDDSAVGVPGIVSFDVTPTSASISIETAFDAGIVMGDKDMIFAHLYRDVAADNGDSTGDVIDLRMRYVSNKLGLAV